VFGTLVFAVASVISAVTALSAPWWSAETATMMREAWRPSAEAIAREIASYRGGWLAQMDHRVPAAFVAETAGLGQRLLWQMGGLVIVGMGLYKLGVFSAARSTAFYGAMAAVGFGVGVPLILYGVARNSARGWELADNLLVGNQLNYWGNLLVGLAWVGSVMLLYKRGWALAPLAAVGRTALTNYLLQTVICTTIFYGHGLGLFARVDRVGQLAIVVAVWGVQVAGSILWLRYFSVGPVEWAWRSATYGRRLPLRRGGATAGAP
jgi:uncharacterized protein